ncbi:hypothetical protein FACS189494_06160 [Spirochaetia bacterium]|nr:hypothetical protein FACS189494_06160 [Spirochaetia bacterium]
MKNVNSFTGKVVIYLLLILVSLAFIRKTDSTITGGDLQDFFVSDENDKVFSQDELYSSLNNLSVEGTIITSVNNDPMIFMDTSSLPYYKYIRMDIKLFNRKQTEAQLFYSINGTELNEGDSIRFMLNNGVNYVYLNKGPITLLRFDPTSKSDVSISVNSVMLTNKFVPEIVDIAKVFLLFLILAALWWVVVFKNTFIKNIVSKYVSENRYVLLTPELVEKKQSFFEENISLKKTNTVIIVSCFFVFVMIFLFFSKVNRIVPWDGDDWATLWAFNRHALPTWGTWNPSRIFPEILGPLAGYFSAFIVYPIIGDYVDAITVTAGLIIASMVTFLYYSLYKLFYTASKHTVLALCSALLVLIMYFLVFQSKSENNLYLLWSSNLCCAFYYMLPNILNSILVCYFIRKYCENKEINLKNLGIEKMGLLILILYYAMFSMLWSCSILACYIFYELLYDCFKCRFENWFSKHRINLVILGFFVAYCIFEFWGGRSKNLIENQENISFIRKLILSIHGFKGLALQMNRMFLAFSFGTFFIALFLYIRNRKNTQIRALTTMVELSFFSAISLPMFYIVAATTAGYGHASRMESVYGAYFYGILIVVLSVIYIISLYPKIFVIFPLILSILFIETTRSVHTFNNGFYTDTTQEQKAILTKEWIEQIKTADKNGEKTVIIRYPDITIWVGGGMAQELFAHKITQKLMDIQYERILNDND